MTGELSCHSSIHGLTLAPKRVQRPFVASAALRQGDLAFNNEAMVDLKHGLLQCSQSQSVGRPDDGGPSRGDDRDSVVRAPN
jgi:hypothetical protein